MQIDYKGFEAIELNLKTLMSRLLKKEIDGKYYIQFTNLDTMVMKVICYSLSGKHLDSTKIDQIINDTKKHDNSQIR